MSEETRGVIAGVPDLEELSRLRGVKNIGGGVLYYEHSLIDQDAQIRTVRHAFYRHLLSRSTWLNVYVADDIDEDLFLALNGRADANVWTFSSAAIASHIDRFDHAIRYGDIAWVVDAKPDYAAVMRASAMFRGHATVAADFAGFKEKFDMDGFLYLYNDLLDFGLVSIGT